MDDFCSCILRYYHLSVKRKFYFLPYIIINSENCWFQVHTMSIIRQAWLSTLFAWGGLLTSCQNIEWRHHSDIWQLINSFEWYIYFRFCCWATRLLARWIIYWYWLCNEKINMSLIPSDECMHKFKVRNRMSMLRTCHMKNNIFVNCRRFGASVWSPVKSLNIWQCLDYSVSHHK